METHPDPGCGRLQEISYMAEFKVVVADPKSGKAYNVDASGGAAGTLVGRKIGDEVDAGPLGLAGYRMKITGGSDRTGIPASSNLPGAGRKKLLIAGGVGFHPKMEGQRRRKMLRAKEITSDFVQVNAKIIAYGEKNLDEIFPAKPAGEKKEGEAASARPPAKKKK
jgi:small subunit ribosomal protein S6e